jgi:hypothetical protein
MTACERIHLISNAALGLMIYFSFVALIML